MEQLDPVGCAVDHGIVQLAPHRRVETLKPAYGWDEPQPRLADDPALSLQAISNYQTAAEAFADGAMRMPERLPTAPGNASHAAIGAAR